jgi:DNA gyrase/topoisomerase IV subunit A|tara:strand:+ start:60 stop:809 length:750 start_codon:yes stop_codon:yes gene_type:complete
MPAAVNGMKECTKCGETKEVSEYAKKKTNKDGLKYACSCCLAIDKKRWKKNNIEKVLAEKKRYRENNREAIAERQKKYYQENKEVISEREKKYRQNNKEFIAEQSRKYYQENKEAIAEQSKKYYQENKEACTERSNARRKNASAGVYEIENKITGKIYVGQSTTWKMRWNQHKNSLSRGKHKNPSLQADYDKYGLDAFEHRVVQEYPCDTSSDALLEHEQRVFEEYNSEGKEVYNENNPSRLYAKQSRD